MDINKHIQINKYFKLRGVDFNETKATHVPRNLLPVLPAAKNSKILEIGCGFGELLIALKNYGYTDVKGIDISLEAIDICNSLELNVEYISELIDYCKNSNDRYDFIIMSHVLEHIKKEVIIETLLYIREYLLNDDGFLCVMVPNAQSNTGCYWAYEDFTHTTLFTAGSLSYVLRSAGFQNITFLDPCGLEGLRPIQRMLKYLLLRIYLARNNFWNRVTSSSYHRPSPQIFTYELRALAKK
jgi:SAM-dependent methyltransferase